MNTSEMARSVQRSDSAHEFKLAADERWSTEETATELGRLESALLTA